MNRVCVVSVDLHYPLRTYGLLHQKLQQMNFRRLQSHLWAGHTDVTPVGVKNALADALHPGDGVFVFSYDLWADDYASHNPVSSVS